MIALDTNVLVRFLVEDDVSQTAKVMSLFEQVIADGSTLFISDVVLCETVWVLISRYGFSRAEVAAVLQRLLNADHLSFSAPSQYARALAAFVVGKGDFADYVIREHGLAAGCTVVATFDQALLKETGYRSP
jgi:predicted nucleic-acid-binding protein